MLYIHVPFCRKACWYCDFSISARLERIPAWYDALIHELDFRLPASGRNELGSIYFGGGTPGCLPPEMTASCISHIRSLAPVSSDAEISLEANPDDVDAPWLEAVSAAGITRLSLGIQALQVSLLQYLHRRHDSARACAALQAAAHHQAVSARPFTSLCADIIYGIPGQSDHMLWETLRTVCAAGVDHVSAYALTLHENTALSRLIQRGRMPAPDEKQQAAQYEQTVEILQQHGLWQYEISNFSRPGKHSRHNSGYWSGAPYLGVGPSAHSFDGISVRSWHRRDLDGWLDDIAHNKSFAECEQLTPADRLNEYIMLSLRTVKGLELSELEKLAGNFSPTLFEHIRLLAAAGRLYLTDGRAYLKSSDLLFADRIAAELFQEPGKIKDIL